MTKTRPTDPSGRASSAPSRPWLISAVIVALALLGVSGWLIGRVSHSAAPTAAPSAMPAATAVAAPQDFTSPIAPTTVVSPVSTIDPARLANRLMDVQWLEPEIIATYPHSNTAFTQGLLLHDGMFYESTGKRDESTLREVNPKTGDVERILALDPNVFAEGLALVGERLIQLTWMDQKAYVYDRATFEEVDQYDYEGQGWGLCYDGERLIMSDGSDRLTFRDPETFAELGTVLVNIRGKPLAQLNELECVGDDVWANVWQTDTIVGIHPADGNVFARVDASEISRDARVTSPEDIDVLNGIAHDPSTGNWFLTGKYWSKVYEVRFVPRGTPPAP